MDTIDIAVAVSQIMQAISSMGLFIIAVWAAKVAIRQLSTSDSQARIKGTTDLFDRFNDQKARDARRWVYHNCLKLRDSEQVSTLENDPVELELLENICNSLDLIALFVRNELIHQNDAIEIYGDSIIRCWVSLRPWIEYVRVERRQEGFLWKNIEWLADEVISYESFDDWRNNGVTIYTPDKRIILDYHSSDIKSSKEH